MVLDLSKIIGGLTDLAKKRHGTVDLHTPIHPPPHSKDFLRGCKKSYSSSKENVI